MILFDIKEIARNLPTEEKLDAGVKEVLAMRVLGYAAQIFNANYLLERLLGEAEELFENDYEIMGVANLITQQLNHIREGARRCGWDPRIKVLIETRCIGRGFYQARVIMDLEETMAYMLHEAELDRQPDLHVTDAVIDNPGIDLSNEISRLYPDKAKRRTPLLSDRYARSVKDNSWAGGPSGNWERYGDEFRQPFRVQGPVSLTEEARLNSAFGTAKDD